MAWEKEWKTTPVWPQKQEGENVERTMLEEAAPLPKEWGLGVENVIAKETDLIFKDIPLANEILEKYTNLKPTHDPYTNPNAFLYYECNCGKRLDPHVKSFSALNNAAMNSDWKIRWGSDGYTPYCAECGKDVE